MFGSGEEFGRLLTLLMRVLVVLGKGDIRRAFRYIPLAKVRDRQALKVVNRVLLEFLLTFVVLDKPDIALFVIKRGIWALVSASLDFLP